MNAEHLSNEQIANEITGWVLEQWKSMEENAIREAIGSPLVCPERNTSLFKLIKEALNAKDTLFSKLTAEEKAAREEVILYKEAWGKQTMNLTDLEGHYKECLAERDAAQKEVERLQVQLSLKDFCDVCWTQSWAPVPEGTENACRIKSSGEWVICQQCQAENFGRTMKAKLDAALMALEKMRSVLDEIKPYFEQRADAEYNGGSPVGNEEMRLLVEIQEAIANLKKGATS